MDLATLRPYRDSDAAALADLYNEGLLHPSRIRLDADSVQRRWEQRSWEAPLGP